MVSANIPNAIDFSKGVRFFCGVLICVFVVFYSVFLWSFIRCFCGDLFFLPTISIHIFGVLILLNPNGVLVCSDLMQQQFLLLYRMDETLPWLSVRCTNNR